MNYSNRNLQSAFNNFSGPTINGYDPKIPFNNNNFINDNTILYNNLSKSLLNEEIREYSIIIDSKDRNYQVYPDPFNYEVIFNPLPKTKEKVNGKYVVVEEPAPIINNSLSNVRYIKLQEIILPLYNKIYLNHKIDEDGDVDERLKVETLKPLTDNMYIVLSIGDKYHDDNYLSTNDITSNGFATIYFDCKLNNTHYFGCTSNGIKYFPQDQLARIDKLKISFMDPYGQPIKCDHIDKSIKSNMVCTCHDPEGDDDTDCFKHNLCHPLNPIFQNHIHLKIGVVQPRLNKLTFH